MIKAVNPSILIPTDVASTSKPLTDWLLSDRDSAPSPPIAEISSAEGALRDANKVMKTMNLHDSWRNALTKLEWVMDVVSQIPDVRTLLPTLTNLTSFWQLHPYAKMAWSVLSIIPKVDFTFFVVAGMRSSGCQIFLNQIQRDESIQALLGAIHDAFDFAQEAALLQNITPYSKQGNILMLMLRHVCCCSDFIQSYAKDTQFRTSSFVLLAAIVNVLFAGKRLLKNIIGGVDKQIEALCNTFVELKKAFLDRVTVTTEITTIQILDNVGTMLANINLISDHLDAVTAQLSDLGM